MRWRGRQGSDNVEDRRGQGGGSRMALGGGIGSIVIVVIIVLLGGDPRQLLNLANQQQGQQQGQQQPVNPQQDELKEFVSVILKDTETVWHDVFRQRGSQYREPKLVIFSGNVKSACGMANAAVGPFYCPADETVYIDLSFYEDLKKKLNAPGDFAQAYVIAHEVGHHVQNLLGKTDEVHRQKGRISEKAYNQLSVKLELQADFYAGLWAHHAQKRFRYLEAGDLNEALNAASAIGDDRLQMQSRGYVAPDSFTHGSSEQRVRWFRKGFETGDIRQGDTFGALAL